MITPLDRLQFYTATLLNWRITPDQYYFLWILHLEKFEMLYEWIAEGGGFKASDIDTLEEKGYIKFIGDEGKQYFCDAYMLEPKARNIFTSEEDADEFIEEYPAFGKIQGKAIPLKNVNRESFPEYYKNLIVRKGLHEKCMEAVKIGKKKNLINMSVTKWLESRQYENILKTKKDAEDTATRTILY